MGRFGVNNLDWAWIYEKEMLPCVISEGTNEASFQGLPDLEGEEEGPCLEEEHESDPLVVGGVRGIISWLNAVLEIKGDH